MKQDYGSCIVDTPRAIELNGKSAFAYGERAEAYRMQGNYAQAISDASKAIEIQEQNGFAYGVRGAAYRQRGDSPLSAKADLNRALELNPNDSFAQGQLRLLENMNK
jgi:Flp pilus assembly protein TadD